MPIQNDTASFEEWLGEQCEVIAPAIRHKHKLMKKRYPFFRATYYRWAKQWLKVCPDLQDAPQVLAIGDIHLENYGTWRDADGRLCWGVNDFDEADHLPYMHDLVRLAASTQFATRIGKWKPTLREACATILAGYRKCLNEGGDPFVLEEAHAHLRKLAMLGDKPPAFWDKISKKPECGHFKIPVEARRVLSEASPDHALALDVRPRMCAGVGSLGKPRFIAFAVWNGGRICREAKAMTAPATAWLHGRSKEKSHLEKAVGQAIRSSDRFYRPIDNWITRRLAPHCLRIDLKKLEDARVTEILNAMAAEIANVHLGTEVAAHAIRKDLKHRPRNWLELSAEAMVDAMERDWRKWCKNPLP